MLYSLQNYVFMLSKFALSHFSKQVSEISIFYVKYSDQTELDFRKTIIFDPHTLPSSFYLYSLVFIIIIIIIISRNFKLA